MDERKTKLLLLSDRKVLEKRTVEIGEPLVDFREYAPEILVDLSRQQIGSRSDAFLKARQTVVEKIVLAAKNLPKGMKFIIKEAYRPSELQQRFFDSYFAKMADQNPELSKQEIHHETSKYIAPVAVAPHPTGGAVDLTLISDTNIEFDMGTEFNASPTETKNAIFTLASNISKQAKVNRKIMIAVLEGVGLVNYPTEWWHWSYGDKYWAVLMHKDNAIYGPLKEKDILENVLFNQIT